ncbi:hypothetical protein CWE09_09910 [Aliidiomarina minuta]|uniref:Uncharacterized protein n=1 Tax=Aliidiomarina minuta TaxID=880057 RepID=A0A432WAC5_9GAMM|nr:hypothetical protein [Aliidiomarina minuta]RUO26985.1 hypothetical protein CWE09_09910 [Aliidiomarina minuta]
MRRFAHTFYLVIIAVLATLLYVEHNKQSDTAQAEEVQAMLSHINHQVAELQTQVESLQDAGNQQPQTGYQIQYHSEDTSLPNQNHQVSPIVSSRALPVDLSHTQLRRRVENENADPDWSYQQEDNIRDLFIEDEHLQSLQLNEVRCRSSLCELQIQQTDPQQPVDTTRLHQQLTINAESLSHERVISFRQDDISYLYIFRN